MKNLSIALRKKFADLLKGVRNDLFNDVQGRFFKSRAPDGTEYPYIVYQLVSDIASDTYSEKLEERIIQFSLFSSMSSSSEVEDMYDHLKTLYDDCCLTVDGGEMLWMKRQQAILMIEDHTTPSGTIEVWHYSVDYSIMIETERL